MEFDEKKYKIEEITLKGETIKFRSYRNLIYVKYPTNPEYQQLNIFSPEIYFEGGTINGFDKSTAPIFMPNFVGGFLPSKSEEPELFDNKPNSIFRALQHGYVVASPSIRGRTLLTKGGQFSGKAPMSIIDYKSAVRFLHFFREKIPGNTERIISNGTSAGGALSALLGTSGNHPDFKFHLDSVGAFHARDDVFAVSCYCPIMNVENADACNEFEFYNVREYCGDVARIDDEGKVVFFHSEGCLNSMQLNASKKIAELFPTYLNGLNLKDTNGILLNVNDEGEGTFKNYLERVLLESANKAIQCGFDVSLKKWLKLCDGKAVSIDFEGYVKELKRIKPPPTFDDLNNNGSMDDLFGNDSSKCCHFTNFGFTNSFVNGKLAECDAVKMMNPMNYIEDERSTTAKHWRIRHGERDVHIPLVVSVILALKLENCGFCVDFFVPWNIPHDGDYDLEELFEWIDNICKEDKYLFYS